MPLAANQIVKECVHSFEISLRKDPAPIESDLSVWKNVSVKQRPRNNSQKFTRCFQNPGNGHYHIF